MKYRLIVSVWGEDYVKVFTDITLPSLMAAGNIPALAGLADVRFDIYTDRASLRYFDGAPAVAEIGRAIELEIIDCENLSHGGGSVAQRLARLPERARKHEMQSLCYMHAMASAAENGAALILLAGDMVFSAGSLINLHRHRAASKSAVMMNFLRLTRETAAAVIQSALEEDRDALDGRALAALALAHLHPVQRTFAAEAAEFSTYPSQLWWRGGENSIVVRGIFPHPLMVVPHAGAIRFDSTVDYDYAFHVAPDPADIHVIADSDEAFFCRLTPDAYRINRSQTAPGGVELVARHMIAETNRRHLEFFARPTLVHAGEADAADRGAAAKSERFAARVVARIDEILGAMAPGDSHQLLALKSFLGPIGLYMSPQTQRIVARLHPADDMAAAHRESRR